ncbi:MAG: hypothetical protein A3G49_02235 [Candidatus Sungbacteria bacterium RIFCSPLOWO2_12_FULL_41_11]|uniref:Uncharacterized protein n=1 Tax=Candidatus Sungbacteria bacterium RIFCSPLOWO2_12_FULL_41_11 TaxID=1802286 RepID=A0A1G2LNH5_9BACT|nr:MAG: hypothetical protein UV01_C0004G0038 [Parcubacteria group bacterium GW2011_GWA2_42_14]OGZ97875.1 MAG: hypothetical protein A3D41_01175 [Candidatus Sungbacteria bacterium RIFCSPHIGHO2_02_FULL_41_12b]OHA13160.1 MAG: hypothetical protein A3G49_02235 [Candidatus Sungbacteria bacterium RIFCSPLOWO2_12_FULL_41_11]
MSEKEFGYRDGGLPGPEEISDEVRRTKEKKGAYRKDFLAVENIPNWFTDIGEEREDEKSPEETGWKELVDDFKTLSVAVQQELLQDMQSKMKRNFFKTKKEMLVLFRYLVDRNLEVIRRGERIKRQKK